MPRNHRKQVGGFSLIELVIVVVIIGIIGAIAIPRMSRGAAGAADSALKANLSVLRNAIDLYAAEHGGTFPSDDKIVEQLTQYTNEAGEVSSVKDKEHLYGPYLRSVPPLPVGEEKGSTAFTKDAGSKGAGWVYTKATGAVTANTTSDEKDETDTLYSDY